MTPRLTAFRRILTSATGRRGLERPRRAWGRLSIAAALLVATSLPASGHLVSDGSLGPLYLGAADTAGFNTDTGEYAINGGPPIPGGVADANGAMVFNFTTIELHNTSPIRAFGSKPLALAATGSVIIGGPFDLRGCPIVQCGAVVVAGGGQAGAGGNVNGQGGNGGHGGRNGKNLPGGSGGLGAGQGGPGVCPNANGGGGGGGGGGYAQLNNGTGGNGAVTGGGGGGEGGATGNPGGNAVGNIAGAGGAGGSATGAEGGNGNSNGGAGMAGFWSNPCIAGGGGGGGGGGAVAANNGGAGANGGRGGGGGGGGGGTKCGNLAGKGGNGGGGCAVIRPFAGVGPLLGGGGGGGSGAKGRFGVGTYAPNGGSGGGALAIDSLASITFNSGGLIDVRGGDASSTGSMGDGAGGGGGGGTVALSAPTINGLAPGSNVLFEGGHDSQGGLGDNGSITAQLIGQPLVCGPDDNITVTSSCTCAEAGTTITFTLRNDSAGSIWLPNSGPYEVRDSQGQVVYRPPCVTFGFIEIPAGQTHNFTWDQRDDGDGTVTGCQWNNAAQVANGDYEFAVSFCTDNECATSSVRCVDFRVGNCVTVTTDKDCYAPGEHVTITITNNGCNVINLRDTGKWEIRDGANNLVYRPPCALFVITTLNPGESYTFTIGGGTNDGSTWDQLDDGNAQVGCGYQNRAQVANGIYQACATYTDAAFAVNTTVCTNFKIANNCVAIDPDCRCNMLGAPIRVGITNGSSQPIGLMNEQPWRILDLSGDVVFVPTPTGPPFSLNPGQTHYVYWDQNDQQGQPAPNGSYSVEFDYVEMPNTPRIGRGGLQLGGCLKLTLDQDCYAPGADVKINVVNTSCQQLKLTLCDVGPVQVFDDQDVTVWSYACDTACNNSRIMQPGEMRSWTWNQKDEGDGTVTNCLWNNAQQVPNGRYCAKVPYADVNLLRGFTAQQCLDIGAGCADLTADNDCHEEGGEICFTLTNNTGGQITLDRVWRILDAAENVVFPPPQCFIAYMPTVINAGSCRQICVPAELGCLVGQLGVGSYTFEQHFVEAVGTEHTYRQDFTIVAAGGCEPPPADCNNNSIADDQDIASGYSLDCNGNLIPDECEPPGCIGGTSGDLDCSQTVDGRDLQVFVNDVSAGRQTCRSDVNGDGVVDLLDVPEYVGLLLCWPNCPPRGLSVRSDQYCYLAGQTATVYVDMSPSAVGSLHYLVFEDTDDGSGAVVYQETRTLNGSATYSFPAPLPQVRMYIAAARWLDGGSQQVGVDGVPLGARPDLPQIPAELCTFEPFTLDASALRSQVEAAVANQAPMTLTIGSRSFEVLLESSNDIVDPQEFVNEPTLALFRGRKVCDPKSQVRLTFIRGLVHALVDESSESTSVYLEPAYEHDPGLPFDLYVGYRSDHVRIPIQDHEQPPFAGGGEERGIPGEVGVSVNAMSASGDVESAASSARAAPTKCLRLNIYYDNDANGTRNTHFNNLAGTFLNKFGNLNFVSGGYTQINTDGYDNPTAPWCDNPTSFLADFRAAVGNVPAGADINLLFTSNAANTNYGTYLGQAGFWAGKYAGAAPPNSCADPPPINVQSAHCWVLRSGSDHRIRIVACQEISHNLGASNNSSSHRDDIIRWVWHWVGGVYVPLPHYSIMRATYAGDAITDANWLDADKTTIKNTLNNAAGTNAAGHFCNP
jgi:hypothetical protein